MADGIKNVLSYGEQRRTLYLNAHNKDDYGRHRAHVLYGLDLSGTGSIVTINPGAVYTSQGQRLFLEVTDRSIDIGPAGVDAFNPVYRDQYPICVMLYLRYEFQVARVAQAVDNATSGPTAAVLGARIVPYDRETCAPAYSLRPRDPVNLDEYQPVGYPHVKNWDKPSVAAPAIILEDGEPPTAVNPETISVQFGEVPLGYVLIGVDPATGSYPNGMQDPGVSIVTYKNVFEQVSELIGQDVMLPVQRVRVVSALVQTILGSALHQGYSDNVVGGHTAPQLLNPHYGTPQPGPSGTREDSEFQFYRQPNFFRDGDPILESLRRADVVMRQWMNRTGSQKLVGLTKDGDGNFIPPYATLDELLAKLDGGLTPATPTTPGNAQSIDYPTNAVGADPANHVLKSGLVAHVEHGVLDKVTNPANAAEGDSHETALAALDIALWVTLNQVLGVSIPRTQLRDASGASFTPVDRDERPEGLPNLARPTSSTATLPYLTTQAFSAVISELLKRSLSGPGVNLLSNPNMWLESRANGDNTNEPPHWSLFGVAGGTWARSAHGDSGWSTQFTLLGGTLLRQDITDTDGFIGQLIGSSRYVSISTVLANLGANGIVVDLIGYSDAAGTTPSFSVTSAILPGGDTAQKHVTATFSLPPATEVKKLRFQIRPAVVGEDVTFEFRGASVNTGMPKAPEDRLYHDVDSRYDNQHLQRLGDLWMGNMVVQNYAYMGGGAAPAPAELTNAKLDGENTKKVLNAGDTNETFMRRDSAKAATADMNLGNHKTVNQAPGTAGTDGVNKDQLDDEAATRSAADAAITANLNAEISDRLADDGVQDGRLTALEVGKQDNVAVQDDSTETVYKDTYNDPIGASLRVVINGENWYFPGSKNIVGPTPKCGCTCTCTCTCTCNCTCACACTCTGTRWN